MLLGFDALGESLVQWLHMPIPGPVLGMLLLWAALSLNIIRVEWVQQTSEKMLSILGLLFVPTGAGIVLYLQSGQILLMLLVVVTLVLLLASWVMAQTVGKSHE
ncbi:hypothetical protein GCM10008938_08310 [Deinococcus roseus]|uniref:CidA/LrgA family protein n=1 Tax=Deinococcus roseus TaxID=392414 RepID=A0ABQ2CZA8_9DEIO|nr:hypothetical protein GCM10008938_08310 [Deinococcus roseus]